MGQKRQGTATEVELAKRRVRGVVAYLSPFRMIEAEDVRPWVATVDQINQRTWDYVALHEKVGGIDVGLPSPYHMVIGRDGALVLPRIEKLRSDQEIVEFFNRCLAALLIGGIYCEAITPDGLDLGSIIDWKYIRTYGTGLAASNQFHLHIRYSAASPLEAIALVNPRTANMRELSKAMAKGLDVLARIPALRGEYLLKGSAGIARRDWGAALSNLWITSEQILSALWEREVITPTCSIDQSKSRRDQLNDTRTWTASARIEMLYQKSVLDPTTVSYLSSARKARNELAHNGVHPTESAALAAFEAVRNLMWVALHEKDVPLFDLDLSDHALSDPFSPPKRIIVEPTHWMAIPKLPGEEELEKAEAASGRRNAEST